MPGRRELGRGEREGGPLRTSWEGVGKTGSAGRGIPNASATDATMMDALLNRAAGSLARQRKITCVKAGGMFGFMRSGRGGILLICCSIIAGMDSPWKGCTPVQIS